MLDAVNDASQMVGRRRWKRLPEMENSLPGQISKARRGKGGSFIAVLRKSE